MGTVVLTTFLSADGVMQAPGHSQEDASEGFTRGGWLVPAFADPEFGALLGPQLAAMRAILLGRRTYDIFAATWPHRPVENDPVSQAMNTLPKYVVSATLTDPTWQDTTVLGGDAVAAVSRLRTEVDGEIAIQGSGRLAQALIDHELIDEYRLLLAPVIVGSGRRLFGDTGAPIALELVDSSVTSSGFVMLCYRPAGATT